MNFPYLMSPECIAEQDDIPSWIYLPHPLMYYSFNAVEITSENTPKERIRSNEFGQEPLRVFGFIKRFYNSIMTHPDIMFSVKELLSIEKTSRN